MYFCTHCNRNHKYGGIYKKHLKWRKIEKDNTPSNKILNCNLENLPEIAQNQISRYLDKMVWDKRFNFSKKREMYIIEINKLILEEETEIDDMLII